MSATVNLGLQPAKSYETRQCATFDPGWLAMVFESLPPSQLLTPNHFSCLQNQPFALSNFHNLSC
jgi:hypothetical protein